MRIAIFSDNFYPEISGISDSICTTAQELAKKGHHIHFFVPRYSKKEYALVNQPLEELSHANIEITRLPSFPIKTGTMQGRCVVPLGFSLRTVKRFKPDIIHVHLPFGVGLEALMASKILKIPLMGTDHTPLKEFKKYVPFQSTYLTKIMQQYNAWFYNNCCFVSSPSQSIFEESHILSKKKVIANPVSTRNELKRKKSNQEKERKFRVLYSGRLAQEKNIDILIKAIALLQKEIPSLSLIITGKGSAEEELSALAKELHIENHVQFKGFLPDEELAEIYKLSDVFAVMSTAETQCLAAMKAMAYKKPVIAADAYGLHEYISGKGILVKPHDVKSVAKAIAELYAHREKRKEIGEKGYLFVQQFSQEKIASEWEVIYTTILTSQSLQ